VGEGRLKGEEGRAFGINQRQTETHRGQLPNHARTRPEKFGENAFKPS
jgi:hypothetical protein